MTWSARLLVGVVLAGSFVSASAASVQAQTTLPPPLELRVKAGDRVKRGQVIGLVGNSGNSTEPHLHFHVADANSPLGSDGVPYRLDRFDLVGRCATFGAGCTRDGPSVRREEIPLGNAVVRFP